jgi:hypothetical protein
VQNFVTVEILVVERNAYEFHEINVPKIWLTISHFLPVSYMAQDL